MLTSRLAVRHHLSGAQIEISRIAIDMTTTMSPNPHLMWPRQDSNLRRTV